MKVVTIVASFLLAAFGAAQTSMQGTVLDWDGKPVSGGDVINSRRMPPDYKESIYRTKTDAQGHFQLGSLQLKQPLPSFVLLIVKTGSGVVSMSIGDTNHAVWTLEHPVNYHFKVVDTSGKPITDATISGANFWLPVKPRGSINPGFPAESAGWAIVKTGEDGSATFQGIGIENVSTQPGNEESGEVDISSPGMADERVGVNKDKPDIRVTLKPGAILTGHLMDERGRSVGAVAIQVKSDTASNVTVMTDKDGTYTAKGLKPGLYDLEPNLGPLSKNWAAKPIDRVLVAGGQELDGLDFHLDKGVLIKGRTLVLETGKPFSGAYVSLSRREGYIQAASLTTNSTGEFEFRTFAGEHIVSVNGTPGGSPEGCQCDETIAPGNSPFVELRIPAYLQKPPLMEIGGTVSDASGQPVADALVKIINMQGGGINDLQTNALGQFLFKGRVSKGTQFLAIKGDSATPEPAEYTGDQTSIPLKLADHAACTLSGRILKEDGSPLAGTKITEALWQGRQGIDVKNVVTGPDGRFAFPPQVPGTYSLGSSPEGYVPLSVGTTTVGAGVSKELGDLTIMVANSSISGTLVDDGGKPMSGINVSYSQFVVTTTDADGKFHLSGLPKGKVQLMCNGPGTAMEFEGQTDAAPVTITLPAPSAPQPVGSVSKPFDQYVGVAAPELKIAKWLNSGPLSLAWLKGKVVVLDFWAVGCGPCVAAIPEVQKLSLEKPSDIVVIGVDAWSEPLDKVTGLMKEKGVTYAIGLDSLTNGISATVNEYPIQGVPTVVVIGRDGKIAGITHDIHEARNLALSLSR